MNISYRTTEELQLQKQFTILHTIIMEEKSSITSKLPTMIHFGLMYFGYLKPKS